MHTHRIARLAQRLCLWSEISRLLGCVQNSPSRQRTLDACGLPTALAASSAADRAGCMRGDPPSTAMVGRMNDCDPPDFVDSDAERLAGGDTLSACASNVAVQQARLVVW